MKEVKSTKWLAIAGAGVLLLLLGTATGRSQVTLTLVNPSSAPVTPGSTFVLDAVVSGLTSPALDGFDLTLAALPANLTLTSASSPLESLGWSTGLSNNFPSGSPQVYGLAGDTSEDVTGSATIAVFDFTVASNSSDNVQDTINFITEHTDTQDLQDANGNPILPLTQLGATVNIVPEPATWSLLLGGMGACVLVSRRSRRLMVVA